MMMCDVILQSMFICRGVVALFTPPVFNLVMYGFYVSHKSLFIGSRVGTVLALPVKTFLDVILLQPLEDNFELLLGHIFQSMGIALIYSWIYCLCLLFGLFTETARKYIRMVSPDHSNLK